MKACLEHCRKDEVMIIVILCILAMGIFIVLLFIADYLLRIVRQSIRIINGINRMGYHLVETQNKVERIVSRQEQWDTWEDC